MTQPYTFIHLISYHTYHTCHTYHTYHTYTFFGGYRPFGSTFRKVSDWRARSHELDIFNPILHPAAEPLLPPPHGHVCTRQKDHVARRRNGHFYGRLLLYLVQATSAS